MTYNDGRKDLYVHWLFAEHDDRSVVDASDYII